MDSSTLRTFQHHQTNPPGSGLLRFRSAPSSLFANFPEIGENKNTSCEGFETERMISRFMNDSVSPTFEEFEAKSPAATATESGGYSGLPPHYPRQNSVTSSASLDSSYGLVGAASLEPHAPVRTPTSNLMRQSSSPAGLFSNLSAHNGYVGMRGMSNGELSPPTSRLKNRLPSSLGMFSQISEIRRENMGEVSPGKIGNGIGEFPFGSWNDSTRFAENDEGKLFSCIQNGDRGNQIHLLSHHLSLPKTSAEIVAVEKFMQFHDSVPCKIRAKRGCATHPRSIAERVRRTRISERMRKLQELVPNMEKQTNTADMLDLAVEYIKDLQKQFKTLSENRANCRCLKSS